MQDEERKEIFRLAEKKTLNAYTISVLFVCLHFTDMRFHEKMSILLEDNETSKVVVAEMYSKDLSVARFVIMNVS